MAQELSLSEFNQQVEALFERHGAVAFAALAGECPQYTLFVDDDRVVAESVDSPRHRYGAFCELEEPLSGAGLEAYVRQWLASGEAYELYLGMNVCRYNC